MFDYLVNILVRERERELGVRGEGRALSGQIQSKG